MTVVCVAESVEVMLKLLSVQPVVARMIGAPMMDSGGYTVAQSSI